MENCHVAIVGGGIGGLTAALSLQRTGLRVSVFERAVELHEVGAGIVVAGSSMQALDYLGVGDKIRAVAGARPLNGYFDLKYYATGELLQSGASNAAQEKACAVHRADLQRILLEAVLSNDLDCIHLDHGFQSLTQERGGVVASFTNGNTVEADALIGCDGVASTVRPYLFGPEPVVYTGKVSFRGLIPAEHVTSQIRAECGGFYVGPERMFLLYFVRGTDFMNVVAHARQPGWEEEGWSIPAETADLLSLYHDFTEQVHAVIEAIPTESLFKWALRDRSPLPQWTVGRVSMLGDAAHPMLPFLGQGGNMAIEDGTVLGRCFAAAADIEEALARYEAARKARGTGVQLASRERAEALMTANKEDIPLRQADGEWVYDPATVPV